LSRAPVAPRSFPTRRSSDLVFHVRYRFKLDIGELAVAFLRPPHVDIQNNVAGGRIDRDRTARAVCELPVGQELDRLVAGELAAGDRKSTRLNSSHQIISFAD